MADSVSGPLLVDEKAAAGLLGVSPRMLQKRRQAGGGPPFVRISSRCVRYRVADLTEWAANRLRHSTADDGDHRPRLASS